MRQPDTPKPDTKDGRQQRAPLVEWLGLVLGFVFGNLALQQFGLSLPPWVNATIGVTGAIILAVLEFGLPIPRKPRWIDRLRKYIREHRLVAAITLAIGVVLGAVFPNIADEIQETSISWFGCPQATELRVLSSPDGIDAAQQLANRYELQTATSNHGCPAVHMYVYAGSSQKVSQAMASKWSNEHLRDLGPRPDVWLRESGSEVDKTATPSPIAEEYSVASSPLVLATADRATVAALGTQRPGNWAETFDKASRTDRGVLRPDPPRLQRVSSPPPCSTGSTSPPTSPARGPSNS